MILRVVLFFGLATTAAAFMPNPDLLTISPAVARAGETVQVTIGGKDLDEARLLRFTNEAITTSRARKEPTAVYPDGELIANTFEVTIPDSVDPGVYEVRSLGYFGLSTARPFLVVEKDAIEIQETGDHSTQETAQALDMNSGVTGLMEAKRVDWYSFEAQAGQRILAQIWAERLDSRADAQLALYDASGSELQASRHHFDRDPFVDFQVPADGIYYLAASDILYRSRGKEYFYRLEVSNNTHLDFAFPPAGIPGTIENFQLYGRNLPGGSLGEGLIWKGQPIETLEESIEIPQVASLLPGIDPRIPRRGMIPAFEHTVGDSNPVRIGFATAPVVRENQEVSDQPITLPCEVAGRFDEPGDEDSFRFTAKAGETWWVEVISDRLGAMTDPWIEISQIQEDGTRTPIADNDEPPSRYGRDALDDLNLDTLDPMLSFTPETDGEFIATLVNRSAGGSLGHLYRLAIREAQPNFQLVVTTELTKTINNDAYPMAPLLRPGGSMVYRVLAFRQDGFEGDITVSAEGLPAGITAPPLVMTGKTEEGYLVLHAEESIESWTGPIQIVGRAGENLEHRARSASIIWGIRVFGNQRQVRCRMDEELVLSVLSDQTEREPCRLSVAEDQEFEVELKQKLEIPVVVEDFGGRTGNLQVEAFGFPGMLRNPPKVTIAEGATEGTLTIDFTTNGNFEPQPGRHQFVLQGIGNQTYTRNPAAIEIAQAELDRINALSEEIEGLAAARTAAEKALKTATDAAKEGTSQFATYSLPITVVVTEPAEEG